MPRRLAVALVILCTGFSVAQAQSLTLIGLGAQPIVLDRAAVESLGLTETRIVREISGSAGAQRSETVYAGVELPRLLDAKGFDTQDRHAVRSATILVTANDGYRASFSWGELYNSAAGKQVVLILKEDGAPLPARAGAFSSAPSATRAPAHAMCAMWRRYAWLCLNRSSDSGRVRS